MFNEQQAKIIEELAPFIKDQKPMSGKTTIYVCTNHVCQLPITDIARLKKMLGGTSDPKDF